MAETQGNCLLPPREDKHLGKDFSQSVQGTFIQTQNTVLNFQNYISVLTGLN